MSNPLGSLYVGSTGLQSAQNALNTTANNLANVNTQGYVRQQVRFTDNKYNVLRSPTKVTNLQQSGLGVSIGDVVHARDIFLDKTYRQESGRQAFYQTCYETVSYVEDMMQELDGERYKESVEDLWTAFQELSKAPADSVTQNLVLQKAGLLLNRSENLYNDIKAYQDNIDAQIVGDVETINQIGDRIFELSQEIQKVESNGLETAMTLRDERDLLIDQLSALTKLESREDQYGFVSITIDGVEFVNELACFHMEVYTDSTTSFSTPVWAHMSDLDKGSVIPVYNLNGDITSEGNTDIGSLKAKLLMRGEKYGIYSDLMSAEAYAQVEDKLLMETEAQIDYLLHEIVLAVNNAFSPIMEYQVQAGNELRDEKGNLLYAAGSKIRILDEENAAVGIDGEMPPRELFSRMGMERYTVAYDSTGKKVYVYNEENPEDTNSLYRVGNLEISDELQKQVTLLPAYTHNGSVDYVLGDTLAKAWDYEGLRISPNDQYPCTFQGFYDKIIGKLGTDGNFY